MEGAEAFVSAVEVFIGVNENGKMKVHSARDYQADAYHTFMSTLPIPSPPPCKLGGIASLIDHDCAHDCAVLNIAFRYPGNINFNLKKFNALGFKGDYSRFCVLVNDRGEEHILSDNEALLQGFLALRTRMTTQGGGYKIKSTKRKPVTKNKSTKKKSTKKKSIKK